ncbi:MAG: RluA family pseudouridine synthase [Selenomonadaceae bacterium]|nr:RluA family pseudouridine synthase [Selenomonadaceae bacterium]
MKKFIVDVAEKNQRLDLFLLKKFSDQTRSHLQKMIAEEKIFVNDRKSKSSYKINVGDTITVEEFDPIDLAVEAENLPLNILYEDSDIIVIDKARGMTVHPADSIIHGTLVNALLYHCKDLSGINGVMRPGIVHRLDKDTSGVMVVAKNDKAHVNLSEQIQSKTARRTYLAIVHGEIVDNAGIIEGAIGRSKIDRKKMAITSDGKSAITEFKVLERFKNFTFVECKLKTGRTHQIRVHMTSIGYPLVGDPKYGGKKNPFDINGQALHSKTLELTHPTTNERMIFNAPLPEDMEKILFELRKNF